MLSEDLYTRMRTELRKRYEELQEKEEWEPISPEERGEMASSMMVEFELGRRMRGQRSGEIDPDWEQAFIRELLHDEPVGKSPKAIAWKKHDILYAHRLSALIEEEGKKDEQNW